MRYNKYIIGGLLATTMTVGTTSCSSDFLDEELTTKFSTDYFNTEEGLEAQTVALYGNTGTSATSGLTA